MNVIKSMYDNNKKLHVYIHGNVEIYYEDGFNIQLLDDNSMITIIHTRDDFFKVLMSHDNIICDFVLSSVIEFNKGKKTKISCEMGVDERSSGFFTHMVNEEELYPVFFTTYSRKEIEEATGLLSSN